jgi:alpha-ribazole phosphatase/probable phosphoglycerate mutase
MNTLILIRHGETDMAGRFCGHSDPELNAAGELQVALVAEEVANLGIERIYSSDLLRASRTASILARRIGVEVELRENLREIYFGLWEGLSWQEIETRFPQEAGRWKQEFPLRSAPEGEAYAAFEARIDAAIEPLVRETLVQTAAVVTHRGVMSHALSRFFGFSEEEAWAKTAPYGAVVVAACAPSSKPQEATR